MSDQSRFPGLMIPLGAWLAMLLLFCACAVPVGGIQSAAADTQQQEDHAHAELPELEPVILREGEQLRVVATTNILGNVVENVGGSQIELTTLLPAGADPHSYNTTPEDLRILSDAHIDLMRYDINAIVEAIR